jgi:hypothetical protein
VRQDKTHFVWSAADLKVLSLDSVLPISLLGFQSAPILIRSSCPRTKPSAISRIHALLRFSFEVLLSAECRWFRRAVPVSRIDFSTGLLFVSAAAVSPLRWPPVPSSLKISPLTWFCWCRRTWFFFFRELILRFQLQLPTRSRSRVPPGFLVLRDLICSPVLIHSVPKLAAVFHCCRSQFLSHCCFCVSISHSRVCHQHIKPRSLLR